MFNVLLTKPCADVPAVALRWLWQPFLVRGKLAILDGDPGIGKSLLAADLAARLSRGDTMPDGRSLDRPHVTLLLNAEGEPSDTVRPRLIAAGADLAKVIIAGTAGSDPLPQLPECVPALADVIREHAVDLIVIDPISAFLPRRFTRTDQLIREGLGPLVELAKDTDCAVLMLRHLLRGVGPNTAYRAGGGTGMPGIVRTALLASRHPEESETRVLAMAKTHLGVPPPALGFQIATGDSGPTVCWTGRVDLNVDEMCVSNATQLARGPRERAADFLLEVLKTGPVAVTRLQQLAKERGMSWNTVIRAKQAINAIATRVNEGETGRWFWELPRSLRNIDQIFSSLSGYCPPAADHTSREKLNPNSQ